MSEILWLGLLLGLGEALAFGPLLVSIVHESAARGFGAGCRVILGATAIDAAILLPALLLAEAHGLPAGLAPWLGIPGTLGFLYLAVAALRDARRLWRDRGQQQAAPRGAFWKGVVGTLANPLAWTLWIATDVPALLRAQHQAGLSGAALFLCAWFGAALAAQAIVALAAARGGGWLGTRGQACLSAAAALAFLFLAAGLATSLTLSHLTGA